MSKRRLADRKPTETHRGSTLLGIDGGVELLSSLVALRFAEPPAEGGPVTSELRVFPDGQLFHPNHEGPMAFDGAFRVAMIASFKATGLRVQIDFNHLSAGWMFGYPSVEEGRAAGWVVELLDRGAEGLWAKVEWNEAGLKAVRAREYLYVSPEFALSQYDKALGESVQRPRLYALALTNRPFLENQDALAASERSARKVLLMDPEIKAELEALRSELDALKTEVAELKGEPEEEPAPPASEPSKGSKEALSELRVATKALSEMRKAKIAELIDAAMTDGRVTPAMRPDIEQYAEDVGLDHGKVSRLLSTYQVQTRSKPIGSAGKPPAEGGPVELSDADAKGILKLRIPAETMTKYGDVKAIAIDGKLLR